MFFPSSTYLRSVRLLIEIGDGYAIKPMVAFVWRFLISQLLPLHSAVPMPMHAKHNLSDKQEHFSKCTNAFKKIITFHIEAPFDTQRQRIPLYHHKREPPRNLRIIKPNICSINNGIKRPISVKPFLPKTTSKVSYNILLCTLVPSYDT